MLDLKYILHFTFIIMFLYSVFTCLYHILSSVFYIDQISDLFRILKARAYFCAVLITAESSVTDALGSSPKR